MLKNVGILAFWRCGLKNYLPYYAIGFPKRIYDQHKRPGMVLSNILTIWKYCFLSKGRTQSLRGNCLPIPSIKIAGKLH